jgi:hypothetical protein
MFSYTPFILCLLEVDKRDPLNDIFVADKYKQTIFQAESHIFRLIKQNIEREHLINYMIHTCIIALRYVNLRSLWYFSSERFLSTKL